MTSKTAHAIGISLFIIIISLGFYGFFIYFPIQNGIEACSRLCNETFMYKWDGGNIYKCEKHDAYSPQAYEIIRCKDEDGFETWCHLPMPEQCKRRWLK